MYVAQSKSSPSQLCSWLAPQSTDAGWCQGVREAESSAHRAIESCTSVPGENPGASEGQPWVHCAMAWRGIGS